MARVSRRYPRWLVELRQATRAAMRLAPLPPLTAQEEGSARWLISATGPRETTEVLGVRVTSGPEYPGATGRLYRVDAPMHPDRTRLASKWLTRDGVLLAVRVQLLAERIRGSTLGADGGKPAHEEVRDAASDAGDRRPAGRGRVRVV